MIHVAVRNDGRIDEAYVLAKLGFSNSLFNRSEWISIILR